MGMIRIHERAGKTKRKPGWQQKQAEYDAWLKSVRAQSTSFSRTPPKKAPAKEVSPSTTVSTFRPASFDGFKGGGTKAVPRPEIMYAGNPEMLERELKARQRKFNSAPAYNKGAAMFVSEEELVETLSSNKRRS